MLRESRALWLAVATAAVVVALSALFATLRNPSGSGAPPSAPAPRVQIDAVPASGPESAGLAAGRAAFERLGCQRCHSLQGQGNPRLPLDGVGTRHDAAALRDWTLGTGLAREELAPSVVRAKQRAAQDPELDRLIDYLQTR
jgi:hypothetical protein